MVALVILAAATSASPVPVSSASALPVIVHTVTSRSCTTLRDTIMPIGMVLKKDDEAFDGMAGRLQQVFSNFANQGGSPTRQELMQLGHSNDVGASRMEAFPSMDSGTQEEEQFYSPSQIVKASQVSAIAGAVDGNLKIASQVLDKSTSASPAGTDAKSDEMRTRAQSLIQLQRTFADDYNTFVNTYVNNQNVAWATNRQQATFVGEYLALLTGQAVTIDQSLSAGNRAQIESVANVGQQLTEQEKAFGAEIVETYNQCNGTHVDLDATPSPKPF